MATTIISGETHGALAVLTAASDLLERLSEDESDETQTQALILAGDLNIIAIAMKRTDGDAAGTPWGTEEPSS